MSSAVSFFDSNGLCRAPHYLSLNYFILTETGTLGNNILPVQPPGSFTLSHLVAVLVQGHIQGSAKGGKPVPQKITSLVYWDYPSQGGQIIKMKAPDDWIDLYEQVRG